MIQVQRYKPPGIPIEAGTPGFNEWGVPLHACNGYIQDAHYWAWLTARRMGSRRLDLERLAEVFASMPDDFIEASGRAAS